jgi:hypothetical protein
LQVICQALAIESLACVNESIASVTEPDD